MVDLVEASLLWRTASRDQAVDMVERLRERARAWPEAEASPLRHRIERWLAAHPRD